MSSYYAKPENALAKSKDLARVGQKTDALQVLHAVLTSKRNRNYTATHEKVMAQYISLAVELQKNVRDAFVQFRQICQTGNNNTALEKAIKLYRKTAEDACRAARLRAREAGVIDTVEEADEDIDGVVYETPESLMAQALSGTPLKEVQDRQILTPWVKYLWESYRTILDVIKNNHRLAPLYHTMACNAFNFCKGYKRNTEFRRLCEMLRKHLNDIRNYAAQAHTVDLKDPDIQRAYLSTRFHQLRVASKLEMWQEAYRTIEDIHDCMRTSTVDLSPALLMEYYSKLAQIFWASDNYLFHAYSLREYYSMRLAAAEEFADDPNMKLPEDEKRALAGQVLLATLCVPPAVRYGETEDFFSAENDSNLRLANLLGFKKETPTRARLLASLLEEGLIADVAEQQRDVYNVLEGNFAPLSLKAKIAPVLLRLSGDEDMGKYEKPLTNVACIRLLQQLSTVFKTMKIDRFMALAPAKSFASLERLIMDASLSNLVQLRVDHRNQLLHFGNQGMQTVRMRAQLTALSKRLSNVVAKIDVEDPAQKQDERQNVFEMVKRGVAKEHEAVMRRKGEIEKRKQDNEAAETRRAQAEARRIAEAEAARLAEEKARLQEEADKREEDRKMREQAIKERKEKEAVLKKMRDKLAEVAEKAAGKGIKAEKMLEKIEDDVDSLDKSAVDAAHAKLLEQEERERNRKRKEASRKLDYSVRARRIEEIDVLIANQERKLQEDKEAYEADFIKYAQAQKAAHDRAMAEKKRLAKMRAVASAHRDTLLAKRQTVYERELAIQEERRERRRKEEERMAAERAEEAARLAEEERLRAEEEERQRQIEEEKERKREAEREEARREALERRAREDEVARKRMEREAELERKDRERRGGGDSRGPRQESSERDWGGLRNREPVRRTQPDDRGSSDRPGAWRPAGRAAARGGDDDRSDRSGGWRGSGRQSGGDRMGGDRMDRDSRFGGSRRDGPSRDRDDRFGGARAPSRDTGDDSRFSRDRFGAGRRDAGPSRSDDRFGGSRRGGGDNDRFGSRGGDRPSNRDNDRFGGARSRGGDDDGGKWRSARSGGGDRDRDSRAAPSRDDRSGGGADSGGRWQRGGARKQASQDKDEGGWSTARRR